MFQKLIVSILTSLASKFMAWALEYADKHMDTVRSDRDIEKKLKGFKNAYKEALKAEPANELQRQALNKSIIDFIRNNNSGGL